MVICIQRRRHHRDANCVIAIVGSTAMLLVIHHRGHPLVVYTASGSNLYLVNVAPLFDSTPSSSLFANSLSLNQPVFIILLVVASRSMWISLNDFVITSVVIFRSVPPA